MSEPVPDIILIKEILEKIACSMHNIKPQIQISGNTMTITCCCDTFYDECQFVAQDINDVLAIENLIIKK